MNFEEYLKKSSEIAIEEQQVLIQLADRLRDNGDLSPIEYRAAKASLQVIIENAIGKAKRILNRYECPFVPVRSNDAIHVLQAAGAISDETYRQLRAAVGFRNAMVHDYMEFDDKILLRILSLQGYQAVIDFLLDRPEYSELIKKRIQGYNP